MPPPACSSTWLYQLIFADVAQCAQVSLNSLRHDRLLARYLAAGSGPDYGATGAGRVVPAIESLVSRTEAVRDRAWAGVEHPPINEEGFFEARHRLGMDIARLLHQGGVAHQQLRAFVDGAAPDMVTQWARLETADSHGGATFRAVAESCAARLEEWVWRRWGRRHRSTVLIDFAHHSDVRNDHVEEGAEVFHHLTIPYWMVHMLRYASVVAHEVAHPYVDHLTSEGPYYAENIADGVALLLDLGLSDRLGLPIDADLVESSVRRVLSETLADAVALRLVGPGYLAALGCYLLGTHEWTTTSGVRLSVPAFVRLRTLSALVADPGMPHAPTLGPLLAAIDAAAEARVDRLASGLEAERAAAALQQGLQPIAERFVRQVLEEGGTLAAEVPAAEIVRALDLLWGDVAGIAARTPVPPNGDSRKPPALVTALEDVAEGKRLVAAGGEEQDSWVDIGVPWVLLRMYLRSHNAEPEEDTKKLLRTAARFASDEPGVGLAGLVLGPADVFVLRRGVRVRRADGQDHDALGALCPYVKRRLLLEVNLVKEPGESLALFESAGIDLGVGTRVSAMTDLQVEPSRWSSFLVELLRRVETVPGVRPVAIFRGVGWANIVIAWSFESGDALEGLHRKVLVKPDERLHRSVTQILARTVSLGEQSREWSWAGVPWPTKRKASIVASVRTRYASQIERLPQELEGYRGTGKLQFKCRPCLGLYDARVAFFPSSGDEVCETADLLWRAVSKGTVRRSITMIEFDASPPRDG